MPAGTIIRAQRVLIMDDTLRARGITQLSVI
jgi:hypothetical protein